MTRLCLLLMPLMAAEADSRGGQDGELVQRDFCIFDPIGANGPLFSLMESSRPAAMEEGLDLNLRAYTKEAIAAEEFRAGQCDAVLLTGTMARDFNRFTGSLDAMGALPGEEEMRLMMRVLSQENARQYLVEDSYEVAGILPAGGVYLFVRDSNIDSVEKLQGKRIATLDHDLASITMVRHVGASVVGSSTTSFAGRFNNGSVDAAYAPAVAYNPMELYRGLGENGGILDYTLAQMNFQILLRRDRFPEGYGQTVRDYAFSRIDEAFEIIREAEQEVADRYWMEPAPEQVAEYDRMLRNVRIQLRDQGEFDATALRLMKGIRCRVDPGRAECADDRE
ncbi:MAG: putative solute-binding protein [Oleiphilaceae bacterium]|nr:putative solute-binding protein [Oleiphilaceae bacterium]